MAGDYKDKELLDYLNASIKRIENIISANVPVIERPGVYAIPKGIVKKVAIVFVVLLTITTFGALLLEGIQKSQVQAS